MQIYLWYKKIKQVKVPVLIGEKFRVFELQWLEGEYLILAGQERRYVQMRKSDRVPVNIELYPLTLYGIPTGNISASLIDYKLIEKRRRKVSRIA